MRWELLVVLLAPLDVPLQPLPLPLNGDDLLPPSSHSKVSPLC